VRGLRNELAAEAKHFSPGDKFSVRYHRYFTVFVMIIFMPDANPVDDAGGSMFPGCPSVCACFQAELSSDQLADDL